VVVEHIELVSELMNNNIFSRPMILGITERDGPHDHHGAKHLRPTDGGPISIALTALGKGRKLGFFWGVASNAHQDPMHAAIMVEPEVQDWQARICSDHQLHPEINSYRANGNKELLSEEQSHQVAELPLLGNRKGAVVTHISRENFFPCLREGAV